MTGFGLLGHLLEMLRASGMDARLDPEAIPALDGALLAARPRRHQLAARRQRRGAGALSTATALSLDDPMAALLIDPQTAGGLARRRPGRARRSVPRRTARARLPRRPDRPCRTD